MDEKPYFVYVLLSQKDGNFYTGYTENIEKRLNAHNNGKVYSTKYRRPFSLIYYEVSFNLDDALKREKYLKSTYGKRYIRNRVKNYLDGLK
jgi:putative endonuclease